MNSSGIPDLVGMIRTMMSAYTPYMLLAERVNDFDPTFCLI